MDYLFISPDYSEIKRGDGENREDAIRSFKSSVWRQGWGADERVLKEYGDWLVYEKPADLYAPLHYRGRVKEDHWTPMNMDDGNWM